MVGSEGRARVSRRLEQAGNSVRQRQGRVSVTFKIKEEKKITSLIAFHSTDNSMSVEA